MDFPMLLPTAVEMCRIGQGVKAKKHGAEWALKEIDQTWFSSVDLWAEEEIITCLSRLSRTARILSEERHAGTKCISLEGQVWIVDPIDGSMQYKNGGNEYCLSAGLVVDGVPTVGIVIRPEFNECFVGIRGRGIMCRDFGSPEWTRLTRPQAQLRPIELCLSSSLEVRARNEKRVGNFLKRYKGFNYMRSAPSVYSAMEVIVGKSDGLISMARVKLWDIAAVVPLLHEGHGVVEHLDGQPIDWHQVDTGAENNPLCFAIDNATMSKIRDLCAE